jgi:hypothetical protein
MRWEADQEQRMEKDLEGGGLWLFQSFFPIFAGKSEETCRTPQ